MFHIFKYYKRINDLSSWSIWIFLSDSYFPSPEFSEIINLLRPAFGLKLSKTVFMILMLAGIMYRHRADSHTDPH